MVLGYGCARALLCYQNLSKVVKLCAILHSGGIFTLLIRPGICMQKQGNLIGLSFEGNVISTKKKLGILCQNVAVAVTRKQRPSVLTQTFHLNYSFHS